MIEEQGENQIKAIANRVEKTNFRHRSKINHFFVVRRTFK